MEIVPGRIGRYEVRRELGRGAMGVVYEAHDPVLERTVALKTIHLALSTSGGDPKAFEKRFLTEARAAARLSHPGIIVVYDVGADPETRRLYMALEYLVGRTLDEVVAGGRLEWREALRIVARVAEALHHAHAGGIVHRDIKPANIMLLASGHPKIMDFGIATFDASLGTVGKFLGSPSYLAPERARGEDADARSDLFSLGAVLYELLTGRKAFKGADLPGTLLQIAGQAPPPPAQLVPGLPPDLDAAVARSLAKDPARRHPSAGALAEDLEDLLAGQRPRHARRAPAPVSPAPSSAAPVVPSPAAPASALATAPRGSAPTLALPAGKRVCLAVLAGPRQGEIFTLERPRALIGRADGRANADIEVPDPEMSRAHALVECHGSRIVLRDLQSTNGTFVAEERISERELEDHAEFRVGMTRFMLIVTGGA